MGRRRPTYSPEFKAEAIRLLRTSSDPVKKIARDLGVSVSTLEAWLKATRPAAHPPLTTDERAELTQLRREVQQLREERDILKKRRPSSRSTKREVCVCPGGEGPSCRAAAVSRAGDLAERVLCPGSGSDRRGADARIGGCRCIFGPPARRAAAPTAVRAGTARCTATGSASTAIVSSG